MSTKRKNGSAGKPKRTRKATRNPTKSRGIRVEGAITVNVYTVISDAVERGTQYAMMRAFKYSEVPKGWDPAMATRIQGEMTDSVMSELSAILNFDGGR